MVSMNRPKFIRQFFSRIFPNPASFEFIAPAKQSSSDKIIWMNPHFKSTKIFNAQVLKWDYPLNKRFWSFKFHCVKVVFISTTRPRIADGPYLGFQPCETDFLANILFRCKTLAGTQDMKELRMTHRKTSLEHKVAVHIASNILPNLSIQKLQLDQALRYATIVTNCYEPLRYVPDNRSGDIKHFLSLQ